MNAQRYKIKAPSQASYDEVRSLLKHQVEIFVTSDRRRMISTGEIPRPILKNLKELGATVTEDPQFELEVKKTVTTK